MTFEAALAYISSLETRGWRLGLDRMEAFAERAGFAGSLGQPDGPQYIHVAGTNGKGSVTAMVQSVLVEAGLRTGGFFSPYVVDPRERVQFNGDLIGREELAALTVELAAIVAEMDGTEYGGLTEFEFKTALGFRCWQANRAEWVALEVGLGGRLDATNIVRPAASVLVSIGLDHVAILGGTLAAIAHEKAGIIKPGTPVVVGTMAPEPLRTIEAVAVDRASPIWRFGQEIQLDGTTVTTPVGRVEGIQPGLIGQMQPHNAALAVAAIQASGAPVSDDHLRAGIARAWLPGRFQRAKYGGVDFIFDGAHNAAAATILRQTLEAEGIRKVVLITNMLRGHDPIEFYRILAPLAEAVHIVPIDFPRAIPVPESVATLQPLMAAVEGHDTVESALSAVLGSSLPVLVTASNYVVGAVLRALET